MRGVQTVRCNDAETGAERGSDETKEAEAMNKNALLCRDYQIHRSVNDLVTLQVEFVLPISPSQSAEIAEALKKIELLFGSSAGVNLVQGSTRPRCQWCGVLHDEKINICPQCGGAL